MNRTRIIRDADLGVIDDTASLPGEADGVIAELAARQRGVVGRAQLLARGLPVHALDYRVRRGRLRPVHRGVYRVGPVAAEGSREVAALLASGPDAVLSHASAARLWDLARGGPGDPVEVSVPRRRNARGDQGIRVHRTTLHPEDRTTVEAIAVTTVARTLVDLAATPGGRRLEQLVARADRRNLLDREAVTRVLARRPRTAGSLALRALLSRDEGPALLRSEAEARFLALVRAGGLEPPETNVPVRGQEVDFLWRGPRLVVEVDGAAYHASRASFEGDRARDRVLAAAGFRVMRVTWRQLTGRPEAVLAQVAQALVVGRPSGG